MSFIDLFNEKLEGLQSLITNVYDTTKKQYINQKEKSFTSYMEMTNVYPKRKDYEDDFQDMTKVESEENLTLDRDGYALAYKVKNIRFKDEYYVRSVYPLTMLDGAVIPGSKFADIFSYNIGFWGYQSTQDTNAYFSLDLKSKSEINKVYLNTNNSLDVTLYIKEDFNKEWVELGMRSGTEHMWNFTSINCVSIKFVSYTSLFSVAKLQAGLASYNKSGILVSELYQIQDLYRLKLDVDEDIPENTDIDFYIRVSGQPDVYSIEDEIVITGGVNWMTDVSGSGIVPSNYIDDSLTVRAGYNEWDIIETYDWLWFRDQVPHVSGVIIFGDEYKVIQGSLQEVLLGDTIFTENQDYSVAYDLDNKKITVKRLDRSAIPEVEFPNLTCSVFLRKRTPIKQARTYVELENDGDIILQGFPVVTLTKYFRVRHVVIKDEIVRDTTQEINLQNYGILVENIDGIDSYVIKGLSETNMIEIEFIDNGVTYIPTPFDLKFTNVDYFSRRYNLTETTDTLEDGEYSIGTHPSGYSITAVPGVGLWVRFASQIAPSGLSYIQLETRFTSTDGRNTSTLREYDLENFNI